MFFCFMVLLFSILYENLGCCQYVLLPKTLKVRFSLRKIFEITIFPRLTRFISTVLSLFFFFKGLMILTRCFSSFGSVLFFMCLSFLANTRGSSTNVFLGCFFCFWGGESETLEEFGAPRENAFSVAFWETF